MPAYEGFEKDVSYITEQSRCILRILGIWPSFDGKISSASWTLKILVILTCYILLLCNVIPGILYYVYDREPDPRVRLKLLLVVVYACMTVVKYSSLVFHEGDIKHCIGHVWEDWRVFGDVSYRQAMMERARVARRFFVFCWAFMYFSDVSYSILVPLSRGKIIIDENTTIRSLSSPAYYIFFDEQKSPAYEIIFVIQSLSGLVASTVTITLCGLTAVFVMHACAQLEILAEVLKNLVQKETLRKGSLNCRLATVVEHHVRVQNFVQMVDVTLQECSLIEVVGCTSMICLLGYCVLMELEDGNIAAMFSLTLGVASIAFNIFLLCYIGDQLTTQAEKVAWTSCTLEWYRISNKKIRSLVLIMAMSNASMKITAGKFIPLSIRTFGDVLKTSAAYFNMLRTVTN